MKCGTEHGDFQDLININKLGFLKINFRTKQVSYTNNRYISNILHYI